MKVAVIGAGAWGLPAGAELAGRGHDVTVIDAFGLANRYSSSSGATRLWRLAHCDPADVRLALESVAAWRRLEERTGRELLLRRGLLWRDVQAAQVAAALAGEGVEHEQVAAAEVARFFPGMRPTGVDAVWQPEAGPVLAEAALRAQADLLTASGGQLLTGWMVTGVEPTADGVRLLLADPDLTVGRQAQATGGAAVRGIGPAVDPAELEADVAVLAGGPWAQPLLEALGLPVRLTPQLGQVTHLNGRDGWEQLPCLHDCDLSDTKGFYSMPTPGLGYKIGFNGPMRRFDPADRNREPDPAELAALLRRAQDLGFDAPQAGASQVCSWTDSPDGEFVIDRVQGGRVVVAVGDSGHGFKFSALAGIWLADLVEDRPVDPDVRRFSLARFSVEAA